MLLYVCVRACMRACVRVCLPVCLHFSRPRFAKGLGNTKVSSCYMLYVWTVADVCFSMVYVHHSQYILFLMIHCIGSFKSCFPGGAFVSEILEIQEPAVGTCLTPSHARVHACVPSPWFFALPFPTVYELLILTSF